MSYIDYLNRFHQFLEGNALPPIAQLLYFRLLQVFNRMGWPPSVRIDNHRLMCMLGNCSERALIQARLKLARAGFIQFRSGHRGVPSQYTLRQVDLFSITDSTTDSTTDSITGSITDSTTVSHNKTETKKKTKTFPPKPPKGASSCEKTYDIEELEALSCLDIPENL